MLKIILVMVAAWPSVASGQSLADLARSEEARRARLVTPSRVYTNADLRRFEIRVPAASTGVTLLNPSAMPDEPANVEADAMAATADFDGRDAAYWAARREAVGSRLRQARIDVSALRLNLAAPPNNDANAAAEKALIRAVLVTAEADLRALEDEQLGVENDQRNSQLSAQKRR